MDKQIRTDIGGNEMKLPEWANWLARDEDGCLYAFEKKPIKLTESGQWIEIECSILEKVEETDDTFETVKWEDEFPTFVDKNLNTVQWLEKWDLLPTRETLNEIFGSKSDEKPTEVKMTVLPEWANWLARDVCGDLYAYDTPPYKNSIGVWTTKLDDKYWYVEETDDTFSHIKWTDEEPTKIIGLTGLEVARTSAEELTRITNAKAHGYDSVPEVADKTERVYVVEDGTKITVGETTSISFEEVMALVENDMIDQPPHYIGNQGLEVEVVLQNFIPRYEDPYVGHRIASAIEYLLRSPLKNQRQDIEKAGKNIQQALAYLDMTDEEK